MYAIAGRWGKPRQITASKEQMRNSYWLVVSTPLKYESQLGWLLPILYNNKTCSKPPTSHAFYIKSTRVSATFLMWGKRIIFIPQKRAPHKSTATSIPVQHLKNPGPWNFSAQLLGGPHMVPCQVPYGPMPPASPPSVSGSNLAPPVAS